MQEDPARARKIVASMLSIAISPPGRCPITRTSSRTNAMTCTGATQDKTYRQIVVKSNVTALIARGDRVIDGIVRRIMDSRLWSAADNAAIVITFDEDDKDERRGAAQGCCGNEPGSAANAGGGRIPTIVITNHGPRGVIDDTPYNHYSLLRTTEAAFGIDEYLGHAADDSKGVSEPWRRCSS